MCLDSRAQATEMYSKKTLKNKTRNHLTMSGLHEAWSKHSCFHLWAFLLTFHSNALCTMWDTYKRAAHNPVCKLDFWKHTSAFNNPPRRTNTTCSNSFDSNGVLEIGQQLATLEDCGLLGIFVLKQVGTLLKGTSHLNTTLRCRAKGLLSS